MLKMALLVLVSVCMLSARAAGQAPSPPACNRDCLIALSEQYLSALAAKDPKRLAVAPALKYTEHGQRLLLGGELWNSISGRGTYTPHVADQVTRQIVTFSTMREAGTPVIVAMQLQVENPQP